MKKLGFTLAMGALAATGVAVAPGAQAATGYARCPDGYMCVFTGRDGSGAIGLFQNGDVDLSAAPGPSGLNNNIESMRNRTNSFWCHYDGINYNGTVWRGGPGGGANTTAAVTNRISSLKRC